jgi:hypothetical protein
LKPDPYDQSYINKWAFIGDSFSAGLGVGLRTDMSCSRYDGGYPHILDNDDRFVRNPNRTAQFMGCSGVTSPQVLKNQVPYLEHGLDVITVSAGGNDVSLGPVLDSCIFQWRRGTNESCEKALNNTQALIDAQLSLNLDALLQALVEKLSPEGKIYYPGYTQFFGDSRFCDNVTWSVWPRMAEKDKQRLTSSRRAHMNSMVSQVNDKILNATRLAGSRVVYVDFDWAFAQVNGRFCEEGVEEPAPDRAGLLFYEWMTLDDGEDPHLINNPGDPVANDTFEGSIGRWVLETLDQHPDWKGEFGPEGSPLFHISDAAYLKAAEFKAKMGLDDLVFWFLPDS